MSIKDDTPISRKRLQTVFEQLANDRKLDILSYAADHEWFTVTALKDDLGIPHTTAHDYCRELHQAGLLHREQMKPATYSAVEFDIQLSLDAIATAVETESETIDYMLATYGDGIIDELLDIWERVDAGELTYREASGMLDMQHADFLRLASELELFNR
ncbi:helix-turn-helix domain-containing protein [Haladaptatus pallidirubidus]|uniref:Transcription regulator TrmB N-terminal domain-containing protein n=1 Tax=Haladaptatus pallidirubidus TaxID=1008152 RepID=A0AAV3UIR0_9EURY|nr:helix-turn-helix domain-containing protein [Haladaptatus pallidirubidus]